MRAWRSDKGNAQPEAEISAGDQPAAAQTGESGTDPALSGSADNNTDMEIASEFAAGVSPDTSKAALAARQIDRWIAQMDRLRLAEYVRYADDKRRVFWSNFMGGVARGVGTAVGFTILGAILVLILQDLAKRNLPVIGETLAQIVSIVQKRLQ